MAVLVSVIVISALAVLLAVIFHVARKTVRRLTRAATTPTTRHTQRPRSPSTPPAYGHLPTPADPIGTLGTLSPDADLSSRSMSERDLLGE